MSLSQHSKPRMRQVMRPTRYLVRNWELVPNEDARLVWLCVGCGTYVYHEDGEEAYRLWNAKRARRWIEHQSQALHKDLTAQYGKPC